MSSRALIAALFLSGPAFASDKPLSAIDWLSRSVEAETGGAVRGAVSVEPLEDAPRAVGFVSPRSVGVTDEIWMGSDAGDLSALLGRMPEAMPLPLRDVLATLVSLEAPAHGPADAFLLARVDTLLALGRLDAAGRLIEDAGPESASLARRAFDIALLTGHENDVCRHLAATPDMVPTYPARVFCLARLGDWPAAALTLETAHALGVLTAAEDDLLGRFLDDGENAFLPPPERPETITPLVFRLYEAIGEPLSTRRLPLAFAHADLRHHHGWKTRLDAAERLYRAGAVSADELLALYLEREPAASGGVWDRVTAVQAWHEADRRPEAQGLAAKALAPAGLARLVGRPEAPERAGPVDLEAVPDQDLSALIAGGREGEAALHAILRAAEAWDGDPDDLSRALAALDAIGFGGIPAGDAAQWAASR